VPLRDLRERGEERLLVQPAPRAEQHATFRCEHAPDLAGRRGAIAHELQHLLREHQVERAVGKRQRHRVALAPADLGRDAPRDREQAWIEIEAGQPRGAAEALA
jgi:hypothetical protein